MKTEFNLKKTPDCIMFVGTSNCKETFSQVKILMPICIKHEIKYTNSINFLQFKKKTYAPSCINLIIITVCLQATIHAL